MTSLTPAPKGYLIKLVRDQTPAIINASGEPGDLFYGYVTDKALYARLLRDKLNEEAHEYVEEKRIGELCDALAVIEGLAQTCHGVSLEELVSTMRADKRGGFLRGVAMYGRHEEFDGR